MPENQNIEWKESWDDKYLEWVCGFANAQGGSIFIGKDDSGNVIGIKDSKKLLEMIPAKIRNTMGIIADVNLLYENSLEYIEIKVTAYPFPVSLRGKYYSRSGSALFEITGGALDEFMLRKRGKTWDEVPIPFESVDTLDRDAIKLFRKKALQSERLSEDALSVDDKILLENLRLNEGEYLKRAAILMFHEDPEKWVTGAYIKVGFFGENDADLQYQDEIHGPLVKQVDQTLELVYQKYLKALISYEDKMYIWNPGELPQEISIDQLFEKHPSIARNPMIADTFFKTGMIESWGRGFERIKAACNENKAILPKYTAHGKGIMVLCKESTKYKKLRKELFAGTIHGTVNSAENSTNDTVNATDITKKGKNVTDDTVNYAVNDTVNGNANDTVKSEKSFKHKMITSDDRQSKILKLIIENEQISLIGIAKELGVSRITIVRDIDKLKKQGLLQREGSDKKGRWIVKI